MSLPHFYNVYDDFYFIILFRTLLEGDGELGLDTVGVKPFAGYALAVAVVVFNSG